MFDQHVRAAADEYANRIIKSPLATQPEFLNRIIKQLQLHQERLTDLRGKGIIDFDALPQIPVFAQLGVTLRFGSDRFYVHHENVPTEARMVDDPKVTTLRATPGELLKYIEQGGAKTDDFHLTVGTDAGVIPVTRVEITIIDQNDTVCISPVQITKSSLVEFLHHLVNSDIN